MDVHLQISAGKHAPQFTGKDVGVAAGNYHIDIGFIVVVPKAAFEFLDFLDFVNQDIVLL